MQTLSYKLEDNCQLILTQMIAEPNELITKIIGDVDFESKAIIMYGKKVNVPRLIANCSGDTFPDYFALIAEKLGEYGSQLLPGSNLGNLSNCCINYFRNGEDYVGWSANEKSHIVFLISLGEVRYVEIRKKENNSIIKLPLANGSLLIMYGCQFHELYEYRVPKCNDVGKFTMNIIFGMDTN